jgi:hypothetical protein
MVLIPMALLSFSSSVPFSPQGLLSALFASHGCGKVFLNLDSTTHKPPPGKIGHTNLPAFGSTD